MLITKKVCQRLTYHNNNGADQPKFEKKNIKRTNYIISYFQININVQWLFMYTHQTLINNTDILKMSCSLSKTIKESLSEVERKCKLCIDNYL